MRSLTINQSITDKQDKSINVYLKDISKIPLIDDELTIELAKKAKQGNKQALDKLITSNLRFAVSVAKQYNNKGLPLVDLIQFANIGLYEAAIRWDETRGIKFISYAVWWIRQSITQALSLESRTVRIPMNQIVNINKINKASDKLEQQLNRTPSIEEISQETGIDSNKIVVTLNCVNKAMSLDTPIKTDQESGSWYDIIPNENAEQTDKSNTLVEINNIIDKLSYRERDIIKLLFGTNGVTLSLEEIASRFGLTTERVRQIVRLALEKLRTNYGDKLKVLL